jgi:Zn-dependent membrane protease YugP
MFFDPLYLIIAAPGLLLGLIAQVLVKSTFSKYSKVTFRNRMTGGQVARAILERAGILDVRVEEVSGFLSDHYDPRTKTLRLSPAVYRQNSVSAAGVAAHEVGHALQHQAGYAPLALRSALVPAAQIGSTLWFWLFLVGLFLSAAGKPFLIAAVVLFSATVLFQLITLPVEHNASARALVALRDGRILETDEIPGARRVLNAAFLTYVAGLVASVLTLVYLLLRSGLLGGRSD